jgi:hypothetical protein
VIPNSHVGLGVLQVPVAGAGAESSCAFAHTTACAAQGTSEASKHRCPWEFLPKCPSPSDLTKCGCCAIVHNPPPTMGLSVASGSYC